MELRDSVSSASTVGSENQTEVGSFDLRHTYMLSRLASLRLHFPGVK